MKYGILSVIALIFGCFVYAQDVDALLKEAEKAEKDLKEANALAKYKEILQVQPANGKALWKTSELTGRIGNRLKDEKQRQAAFTEARQFAETALKENRADADANYALAAAAARVSTVASGKDKARSLRDMKNYADTALQINPGHARALYMMGKWNFDIFSLNVGEKAAVKVLFGGMPKATLDDAIDNFEKARAADPLLVINYLDLAKAYVKNHQTDKAIEVLNRMIKLPPKTGDDQDYKSEGRTLLASLQ
ncbi:MAG: tetratricopeptide repeat protein [Chitinophagaceae bacterium]|nr:tetratricopeptide repeat protein [Chitinophagaceae bacterium]